MRRLIIGTWIVTAAVVVAGTLITVTRLTEPSSSSVEVASTTARASASTTTPIVTSVPVTTSTVVVTTTTVAPEVAPGGDEGTAPTTAPGSDSTSPGTTIPALPEGGTIIPWDAAMELIRSCQVARIAQSHDRIVVLDLRDGSRRLSVEPELDAPELQSPPECGPVPVGTQ